MEKSTSWEVNRSSAGQEAPHILWNSRFNYLIQKCPPTVPIFSQINPVHASLSNFLKIHFNITFYYVRFTSSYHDSSITTCTNIWLFYLWDLKLPRREYKELKYFVTRRHVILFTFRASTLHLFRIKNNESYKSFCPLQDIQKNANFLHFQGNLSIFIRDFSALFAFIFIRCFSFVLILDAAGSSTLLTCIYLSSHTPSYPTRS